MLLIARKAVHRCILYFRAC